MIAAWQRANVSDPSSILRPSNIFWDSPGIIRPKVPGDGVVDPIFPDKTKFEADATASFVTDLMSSYH